MHLGLVFIWHVTEQQWELGCAQLCLAGDGWSWSRLPAHSVCIGQPGAVLWVLEQPQGLFLERWLSRCCRMLTGPLWLPWDRHELDSLAGQSELCKSIAQERLSPLQSKVPRVPGASQGLLVVSFMTMPSASTAMAAATASPRRMIRALVMATVGGGDVAGLDCWGSSWYVGPSTLVMPMSMTLFCASTPAARRTGH